LREQDSVIILTESAAVAPDLTIATMVMTECATKTCVTGESFSSDAIAAQRTNKKTAVLPSPLLLKMIKKLLMLAAPICSSQVFILV